MTKSSGTTTNRGRSRSDSRRAAKGKAPKPTPATLRAIAANTTPRGLPGQNLGLEPCGAHLYGDVLIVRNAVRRSGVVPYLDRRLHVHVGTVSRLGAEALLTALLLTAYTSQDAKRTAVTRTMASMHSHHRYELDLYAPDTKAPPGYRQVHKQIMRFEQALREGWVDEDGTRCDMAWFTSSLLRATVPKRRLDEVTAVAIDGTAIDTWARRVYWTSDDKASAQKAKSGPAPVVDKSTGEILPTDPAPKQRKKPTFVDPWAVYQRDVADVPGLAEPKRLRRRKDAPLTVGEIGLDGRRIVSKDVDARVGWKTATNTMKGRYYTGFEAHFATPVRSASWQGNPDHLTLGPGVPNYVIGVHVTASGEHRGHAGMELVNRVMSVVGDIDEVVVDRGYTMMRPETFHRPLHELGIDVVMDFPERMRKRCDTVTVTEGAKSETMLFNTGTFLHFTLPRHRRTVTEDPRNSDEKQRAAAQADLGDRARTYRWSEKERLPGGDIRFVCPLCAGRAVNPQLNQRSASSGRKAAPVVAPKGKTKCCHGTITTRVDQPDHYQKVPWGTPAWAMSFGRRANIEGVNARMRTEMNLQRGVVRAFGSVAATVAITLLTAALNLRIARTDSLATNEEKGLAEFGSTESSVPASDGIEANSQSPPPLK